MPPNILKQDNMLSCEEEGKTKWSLRPYQLGESPWFRLKYAAQLYVIYSVNKDNFFFYYRPEYAVFLAYHISDLTHKSITYLRGEPKQELLRVADINTWGLNFRY